MTNKMIGVSRSSEAVLSAKVFYPNTPKTMPKRKGFSGEDDGNLQSQNEGGSKLTPSPKKRRVSTSVS